MSKKPTRKSGTGRRPAGGKQCAAEKKTARAETSAVSVETPSALSKNDSTQAPLINRKELRRRCKKAGDVIRDMTGRDDRQNPSFWEQGAYQLWMRLVVELIVLSRGEPDLSVLSSISKMLHEHRKIGMQEVKHSKNAASRSHQGADPTELPEQFGDVVRRIYGTNFQEDAATGHETESLSVER